MCFLFINEKSSCIKGDPQNRPRSPSSFVMFMGGSVFFRRCKLISMLKLVLTNKLNSFNCLLLEKA